MSIHHERTSSPSPVPRAPPINHLHTAKEILLFTLRRFGILLLLPFIILLPAIYVRLCSRGVVCYILSTNVGLSLTVAAATALCVRFHERRHLTTQVRRSIAASIYGHVPYGTLGLNMARRRSSAPDPTSSAVAQNSVSDHPALAID